MNLVSKLVGVAAALAVTVALFGASLATTHAQGPFTAYGVGQSSGATVQALIAGTSCGSATADAGGQWLLSIDTDAPCNPSEGDTINFYLDGATVSETATWTAGGTPETSGFDPDIGITLTVSSTPPPAGGGDAPGPSDTGNAGIAASTAGGTSAGLWLALMALTGLSVVGSRVATRSR